MWLKQQIASHNIANVETPGYKAKKVEFRDVLYETAQERAYIQQWWKRTETPRPGRTGNNVQVEKEELELWKAYTSIRLSQGVSQASCPRCGM